MGKKHIPPFTHGLRSLARTTVHSSPARPVGATLMSPCKTIVQNASTAKTLTELRAAAKAAHGIHTLSRPAPFVLLAPADATVEKPTTISTDMIVPVRIDAAGRSRATLAVSPARAGGS